MEYLYYIVNNKNGKVLNKKGGWSDNFLSYRLASFETKEAAEAAIPPDQSCKVIESLKQTESKDPSFKFILKNLKNKCYLDNSNEFKSYALSNPNTVIFNDESLALDKAEELNINLEEIQVVRVFQLNQKKQDEPKS